MTNSSSRGLTEATASTLSFRNQRWMRKEVTWNAARHHNTLYTAEWHLRMSRLQPLCPQISTIIITVTQQVLSHQQHYSIPIRCLVALINNINSKWLPLLPKAPLTSSSSSWTSTGTSQTLHLFNWKVQLQMLPYRHPGLSLSNRHTKVPMPRLPLLHDNQLTQ